MEGRAYGFSCHLNSLYLGPTHIACSHNIVLSHPSNSSSTSNSLYEYYVWYCPLSDVYWAYMVFRKVTLFPSSGISNIKLLSLLDWVTFIHGNRCCTCTRIHGVIFQNTAVSIATTMRTSNLTFYLLLVTWLYDAKKNPIVLIKFRYKQSQSDL